MLFRVLLIDPGELLKAQKLSLSENPRSAFCKILYVVTNRDKSVNCVEKSVNCGESSKLCGEGSKLCGEVSKLWRRQ